MKMSVTPSGRASLFLPYIVCTILVTTAFGQTAVINEFLAAPTVDVNGDGIYSATGDEFVEIVNISGVSLDLSSWTLSDAALVRHTFPLGTILPSYHSVLVFGGGTVQVSFPGLSQIASGGGLSLNNTADDIWLKDSLGTVIDHAQYLSPPIGISIGRSPDYTGAFGRHDSYGSNYSPGYTNISHTPLPVELLWFRCRRIGVDRVLLEWMTVTETNNYGFEIERRPDASGKFYLIDNSFVAGHGSSAKARHYQFTDVSSADNLTQYRLKQIDNNGSHSYSSVISLPRSDDADQARALNWTVLSHCYPNPFNPSTTISYALPERLHVTLTVFNTLGQKIVELVNAEKDAGQYEVTFDATGLASGVYLYRLQAGDPSASSGRWHVETRKLILLR